MFGIGIGEIILIAVVALVVFGPEKLPEIGAAIGRTLREFKKATREIETQFHRELGDPPAPPAAKPENSPSATSDSSHHDSPTGG